MEVSSLRHNDGIKYLDQQEFFKVYPLGNQIGSGFFGTVYDSGKYAIKKFDSNPMLLEFSQELNFYASVNHPCIMKPLAWTVMKSQAYLTMKQGIQTAVSEGKISVSQIICDTLSAIAFLNDNGIAHCDIKPDNII